MKKKTLVATRAEQALKAQELESAMSGPPPADPPATTMPEEDGVGRFARIAKRKTGSPFAAGEIASHSAAPELPDEGENRPSLQPHQRGRKVRMGQTAAPVRRPLWLAIPLSIGMAVFALLAGWHWFFRPPAHQPAPQVESPQAAKSLGSDALWSRGRMPEMTSLSDRPQAAGGLSSLPAASMPGRKPPPSSAAAERAVAAAAERPMDPTAQHQAGVTAIARGDLQAARGYFQSATKLAPMATASLFNLAQLDFEEGLYEDAAEHFARFRKLNPRHPVAAYRALVCDLVLGRSPVLDETALTTNTPAGLYARAALAWKSGDIAGAREHAARARALGSSNTSRYEADLLLLGYHED